MRIYKIAIPALLGIWVLGACQAREPQPPKSTLPPPAEKGPLPAEVVRFATADGWELAATLWPAPAAGRPAAILLHMLPADRHSYNDFGPALALAGFNVLALDSRGHGDSRKHDGGTEDYTSFDARAYNDSVKDIAAAKAFLQDKGADVSRVVLVGASIGANFALIHAAGDADVKGVVLLSPGLDYHGVKTEEAMKAFGDRPCYLVASDEDAPSAECITALKVLNPKADYKMFRNAGHGTNILGAEPKFKDELVDWMGERIK